MVRYPLPTWVMALRMKCTRQLWHVAGKTLETAALSPSWASEMTSYTPRRPRRIRGYPALYHVKSEK